VYKAKASGLEPLAFYSRERWRADRHSNPRAHNRWYGIGDGACVCCYSASQDVPAPRRLLNQVDCM